MTNILIVDDDSIFSQQLSLYIDRIGYDYKIAGNMKTGFQMAEQFCFDIIFLDVILPDANGLSGINRLKAVRSSPEVVIITGDGDIDGAEMALNNGAWDYLVKPPAYHKIKLVIQRIIQFRNEKTKERLPLVFKRDQIIGNSSPLNKILKTVAKASLSNGNVFITGETGTGKELVAKVLHDNSHRRDQPFIIVDCTNLPKTLAGNILFGHRKGTYTGAEQDRSGLISQSDGGTLFLDEVGDLDPSVQKSLLRVLQEKKFRPIGAKTEISCDFRVISASNKDLAKLVDQGRFRKDLYYRLVVFHIDLPPLRQRQGDIRLILNHYIPHICEQMNINVKGISHDFVETLEMYDWPGNIRELINLLHIACANAFDEPMLYPHFLPKAFRIKILKKNIGIPQDTDDIRSRVFLNISQTSSKQILPYKAFREYVNHLMESRYIDYLAGLPIKNVSEICRMSGLSRSRMYQLFKKHNKKIV
ncbi:sigma-54 dependent transcriptional regulator [Desulfobacula sp.]|uniref:sigma-54-dependent transcriptional regulator n=1 Tax=Desulfobacula sp. TaxID=2593537 RepID=UPI00263144D7|nr:sigma-54 dependent transcriptional regulator [Desulfobacula sp.]